MYSFFIILCTSIITCFLGKVTALGVLCCFALFICLTLLASFFLPSHLSFKNMYMYVHCIMIYVQFLYTYIRVCMYIICVFVTLNGTTLKDTLQTYVCTVVHYILYCYMILYTDVHVAPSAISAVLRISCVH